jgi:hypothetical protein
MDMSKWDADQPGITAAWWDQRRGAVPAAAYLEFQRFLNALGAYNAAPGGGTLELSTRVAELIEALPNKSTPAPVRERLARALGDNRIGNLLHPSSYTPASDSQNLILGLTNLLEAVGGTIVPARYRGI